MTHDRREITFLLTPPVLVLPRPTLSVSVCLHGSGQSCGSGGRGKGMGQFNSSLAFGQRKHPWVGQSRTLLMGPCHGPSMVPCWALRPVIPLTLTDATHSWRHMSSHLVLLPKSLHSPSRHFQTRSKMTRPQGCSLSGMAHMSCPGNDCTVHPVKLWECSPNPPSMLSWPCT